MGWAVQLPQIFFWNFRLKMVHFDTDGAHFEVHNDWCCDGKRHKSE